MLNKEQIQKLVQTMERYKNQTVVITSWFMREDKYYRIQTMENVDIIANENTMCIMDENDNKIEFPFDKIEGTYTDVIDIFEDGSEPETHVIFVCFEEKFDFVNLV